MFRGFKNFLMQGELIVIAVGLVVALAFSTLIVSFTTNIITPLVNAAGGGGAHGKGLGWTINGQRINLGAFISAIIYFIILMAVIYFVIVVPYRAYMRRRGTTVFGEPHLPRRARTASHPICRSMPLPACTVRASSPRSPELDIGDRSGARRAAKLWSLKPDDHGLQRILCRSNTRPRG